MVAEDQRSRELKACPPLSAQRCRVTVMIRHLGDEYCIYKKFKAQTRLYRYFFLQCKARKNVQRPTAIPHDHPVSSEAIAE